MVQRTTPPERRTDGGRRRITSCPNPDGLELGCDRMWDEIERLLRRHGELLAIGDARTPHELVETYELWRRIQELRAYSAYYREIVLRDARRRSGEILTPQLLVPKIRR